MNLIRSFLSVFLVALLAISAAGWLWAGGLPTPRMEGARVVLTLCGLCSIGCLWLLWTAKPGVTEQAEANRVDAA